HARAGIGGRAAEPVGAFNENGAEPARCRHIGPDQPAGARARDDHVAFQIPILPSHSSRPLIRPYWSALSGFYSRLTALGASHDPRTSAGFKLDTALKAPSACSTVRKTLSLPWFLSRWKVSFSPSRSNVPSLRITSSRACRVTSPSIR